MLVVSGPAVSTAVPRRRVAGMSDLGSRVRGLWCGVGRTREGRVADADDAHMRDGCWTASPGVLRQQAGAPEKSGDYAELNQMAAHTEC